MRILKVYWSLLSTALGVVAIAATLGCHRTDVHQTLKENLRPAEGSPVVLAVYEPWFGDADHIDVGYSSHDRVVLNKQIEQARNMGISGFVVDWYGQRKPFLDQTYALLQQTAAQSDFRVALMYDEPEDSADPTTAAMSALDYAYAQYIGPKASARHAYLTYNGRPVVFVWPRSKQTDWKSVREHLTAWEVSPLLIIEDGAYRFADHIDGFYAWVQPGKQGWSNDGSNWGREYLESFYKMMKEKYPNKIAVGAAWPGFNDRQASWSMNRYMDARCGKTFEDSLRLFRRFYTNTDPLPFLLVITWNDYEEGTAIERGLNNCRGTGEPPPTRSAGSFRGE